MLANFTSPIFNYFISIAPENIKGLSRTSERSKLFFHKIFHRGVNTGYLHMGCYIFGCIRLWVWVVLLLWVMGAGAPGLCILCLAGISLMAGWWVEFAPSNFVTVFFILAGGIVARGGMEWFSGLFCGSLGSASLGHVPVFLWWGLCFVWGHMVGCPLCCGCDVGCWCCWCVVGGMLGYDLCSYIMSFRIWSYVCLSKVSFYLRWNHVSKIQWCIIDLIVLSGNCLHESLTYFL